MNISIQMQLMEKLRDDTILIYLHREQNQSCYQLIDFRENCKSGPYFFICCGLYPNLRFMQP